MQRMDAELNTLEIYWHESNAMNELKILFDFHIMSK